jgi:hypothetical protein
MLAAGLIADGYGSVNAKWQAAYHTAASADQIASLAAMINDFFIIPQQSTRHSTSVMTQFSSARLGRLLPALALQSRQGGPGRAAKKPRGYSIIGLISGWAMLNVLGVLGSCTDSEWAGYLLGAAIGIAAATLGTTLALG